MSDKAIGNADRAQDGSGRTALVTGASSGIGMAMSQLLAAKGFGVVTLARRKDRLDTLCAQLTDRWNVPAYPLAADLALADTPARVVDELKVLGIEVDFLVNNAGYAHLGRYEQSTWETHEARVRVMGTSTLELTHRLLPTMVEHQWGRIINVASIAGLFEGSPRDVLYSATKSMVIKFSEGIAAEYADLGINCTASIPGFTATEIFSTSRFENHVQSNPAMRMALMQPETVARQAYQAVMTSRPSIVHGWHHKALAAALLHLPKPIRRQLAIRIASVEMD